jgi:hypothetical protein
MDIDSPLNRTNAGPFQEHLERKDGLFHRHSHFTKRFLVRFGIRLAAVAATKPAKTIAMFSEARTSRIAVRAVHGDLHFGFRLHTFILHEALRVCKR